MKPSLGFGFSCSFHKDCTWQRALALARALEVQLRAFAVCPMRASVYLCNVEEQPWLALLFATRAGFRFQPKPMLQT